MAQDRLPGLTGGDGPRRRGRARRALDDTVKALRDLGRIDPVDMALLGLARVLADELDAAIADHDESRYTRGTLAARYHAVLSHLLARPDVADSGATIADLFPGLVDAPPA